MPIANCFISSEHHTQADNTKDLIRLWGEYSGIQQAEGEMTVNILSGYSQFGKKYAAMATLLLPSIWSKDDISALQQGLAHAISDYYLFTLDQVFVTTSIVGSGFVVENGREVKW